MKTIKNNKQYHCSPKEVRVGALRYISKLIQEISDLEENINFLQSRGASGCTFTVIVNSSDDGTAEFDFFLPESHSESIVNILKTELSEKMDNLRQNRKIIES